MRSFHGSQFLLMLSFFFFFLEFPTPGNALFEQSTRSELVEQAGYGEEKLSSVLVTGTVLCEACLRGATEKRSWPVAGALVAISCMTERRKLIKWAQEITDDYGEFIIDLPSNLHAIPHLDKVCAVRILGLPKKSPCRSVSLGKSKGMKLSSIGNSIRTYTAGNINFQQTCLRKPSENEE